MAYSVPANPEWDLPALLDQVPDLTKKAIAGGVFLGEIDDIADSDDVSAEVIRLQSQGFSALRTLSKNLGATQEERRADFGAEDKNEATIKRIAELRVPVNSSFILLTKEEAFALETIATEIGADQEKIDECVDDDDIETNLTSSSSSKPTATSCLSLRCVLLCLKVPLFELPVQFRDRLQRRSAFRLSLLKTALADALCARRD